MSCSQLVFPFTFSSETSKCRVNVLLQFSFCPYRRMALNLSLVLFTESSLLPEGSRIRSGTSLVLVKIIVFGICTEPSAEVISNIWKGSSVVTTARDLVIWNFRKVREVFEWSREQKFTVADSIITEVSVSRHNLTWWHTWRFFNKFVHNAYRLLGAAASLQ